MEEREEKKKCAVLYVYIDEAHAGAQKKTVKRRHSCQIPVAVVCEGMEEERKNRNRTICPYYIVDENCSTKWLDDWFPGLVRHYMEKVSTLRNGSVGWTGHSKAKGRNPPKSSQKR